jgi:5'-3' exonuclease
MYSPLATDVVNLAEFYDEFEENKDKDAEFKTFPFDMGTPFPSLAQLLSVLPPQSATLLPEPLAELMLHPSSPLIPYYPADFTSDPNGKRQSWEAIVQIPFIEAGILLDTVERVLEKDEKTGSLLTTSERRRNAPGTSHLFVPSGGGEDTNGASSPNGAPKSKGTFRATKAKGSARETVASSPQEARKPAQPKGKRKAKADKKN